MLPVLLIDHGYGLLVEGGVHEWVDGEVLRLRLHANVRRLLDDAALVEVEYPIYTTPVLEGVGENDNSFAVEVL